MLLGSFTTVALMARVAGSSTCPPQRTFTGTPSENLGLSVADAGDVNGDGYRDLIVGAPEIGPGPGGAGPGHAYVYFGGPGADNIPDRTFTGEADGDQFGFKVASAGDVNGDGYPDLIVGALFHANTIGAAYVFFGGPGADNVPDLTLSGEHLADLFGATVGSAGDWNGDGFGDVAVGAPHNDANGSNAGRLYIFFGGITPNDVPDVVVGGFAPGDAFAQALAPIGDLNGDGRIDLLVGAPGSNAAVVDGGRAYVFFGGAGADTVPDRVYTGTVLSEYFGYTVAGCGDVNGDGWPDVAVGAPAFISAQKIGHAYVFFGGPAADNVADLVVTGIAPNDQLGWVAGAGDLNEDGYADIAVGADQSVTGIGRTDVFYGGPVLHATPDLTFTGTLSADQLGDSQCGLDFDGDGHVELLIGALGDDAGGTDAGRVYAFRCVATTAVTPPAVAEAFLAPWPNPASRMVHLAFDLPREAEVTVGVYDLAGRQIARPIHEYLPAGSVVREWRPEHLASGEYWMRAQIGDREFTRTLDWSP